MRTWRKTAPLALALVAAAACSTKEVKYSGDADTGAAAPATVRDMSETQGAPGTTDSLSERTNRPGASGDRMGRANPSSSVSTDSMLKQQHPTTAQQGAQTPTRNP
ncbi:MAG TPA: hypothetical protein VFS05_10240 [Gemmatimonadaceae bacterium]|nr:hypothetical protein [Gemmatimonadaceae bacterium]